LGLYLKNMDSDEYNSYLKWRTKPLPEEFIDKINNCILANETQCRLCDTVAKNQLKKVPNYIKDFDPDIVLDRSFAMQFDGSNTYVEIEDQSDLRLSEVFTITAWIYIDGDIKDLRIVDKNTAGSVDGFGFDIYNKDSRGFLRLCGGQGCWNGLRPILPDTWYHVAAKYISSNAGERLKTLAGVFFYVNGELDYDVPFPVPMYGLRPARKNNLPFRIGRAGSGNSFWKGWIDDVSVWDIPLSKERIHKLMFERLGGKEEGLLGYWSFNEGSGSKTIDHSKARRDASVYNAVWHNMEKKELILNDCV